MKLGKTFSKIMKPVYRLVSRKPAGLPLWCGFVWLTAMVVLKDHLTLIAMMVLTILVIICLCFLHMALKGVNWQISRYKHAMEKLNRQTLELEKLILDRTQDLETKNLRLQETMTHLKEAQNQLILQEKMASVGMLTAGIAHEIKNPLNFITNFSDVTIELIKELKSALEDVDALSTEKQETIRSILEDITTNCQKINEHGKRAASTVKNMLIQSRSQKDEKTETDLNKLVEEYLNLAYHGMRAQDSNFNIKIVKELSTNLTPIVVSQQSVGRVILNIINNGLYAANEKREKLGKDAGDFMPTITVKTREDEKFVYIHIRDNGVGIPPESRQKIFEPFFTTKPSGVGTGLGLPICYEIIVEDHKGELRVESEVNQYTEFTIALPKKATAAKQQE